MCGDPPPEDAGALTAPVRPPDAQPARWLGTENDVLAEDQAVHRWYRFVLAFPPHLVRRYLDEFGLGPDSTVLDPFCGTGTTLVEAKRSGIGAVGIEAAPMAHFASTVKTRWELEADALLDHAQRVADRCHRGEGRQPALRTLPAEAQRLLLRDSISPLPLHRALTLLDAIEVEGTHADNRYRDAARLALARILPTEVGNLRFGPEVGVAPVQKVDAPVVARWRSAVEEMATDLTETHLTGRAGPTRPGAPSQAILGDARQSLARIEPGSIDAVITSPPYPNEKDYTRTTRLESVVLGFISSRDQLRAYKRSLMRSNTRTVYKDDDDDRWVSDHPEVERLAAEIEDRRVAMGKTSGFERQYHRVTRLYFGGMAKHLEQLKAVLRPGARLAYVVGDQASFLRVLIKTGTLLADLAQWQGYELERIDLFRTRPATATRALLREEVVVLRWPG